jgi:flavin reductase (DIM6/NTAB) family NADH-FMN oxidoreductase RutF
MERTQPEIDPRELRNALGRFASGITVITTEHEGEIHGMTANAFVSVSLEPPLVLVSVDNRALMHEKIAGSGRYGVNVLSESQGEISDHFAGRSAEGAEISFTRRNEMPVLEGAIAHFVCRVVDAHPAGDHTLYIGEVEYLDYEDGKPLVFFTGGYGELKAQEVKVWEHGFWW